MPHVVSGEYATIIKTGVFNGYTVTAGDRAKVIAFAKRYSTNNKKVWACVDLIGEKGNTFARIEIPSWWLRPRSILDDLAGA